MSTRATDVANDRAFFGHPRGLMTLFFTEMWERFSYYGMVAFLVFYVKTPVAEGGLGESDKTAGIVVAMYTSLVYLVSLPGGWIADRFIGQQKAVLWGGVFIMLGHITLGIPAAASFYPGLGLIIFGTGLLKPNVSTIVGQLYGDDPRRDSGFAIYYMGINIGGGAGPIICGYLAQKPAFRQHLVDWGLDPNLCWHFGFGAAAVGMAAGLVQYVLGLKYLGAAGRDPTPPKPAAERKPLPPIVLVVSAVSALLILGFAIWRLMDGVDKAGIADSFGVGLGVVSIAVFVIMQSLARDGGERSRVIAMAVLFFGCLSFFGIFGQASTTLNVFAEKYTQPEWLGVEVPAVFWQSINSICVIVLAPFFTWLWLSLARKNKEPFSVNKFAIGMVIAGLAFVALLPTIPMIDRGEKTSPLFLIGYYLIATAAEMCISPVGLSVMNQLAPKRLEGFVMGIWFLGISVGFYIAGRAEAEVGALAQKLGWGTGGLFYLIMIFAFVVGAILAVAAKPVRRMLTSPQS